VDAINKQLLMTRLCRFTDEWEGAPSNEELERFIEKRLDTDEAETRAVQRQRLKEEKLAALDRNRRCSIISCWHASDDESYAMWELYCPSPTTGVAVRTTLSKLQASVGTWPVRPINYSAFTDQIDNDLAFRKRPPFWYEQEYRMCVWKEPGEGLDAGYPLPWKPEEWLDSVIVHPKATDAFVQVIRWLVQQTAPKLSARINRSSTDLPAPCYLLDK
jgi:hypothetical protein